MISISSYYSYVKCVEKSTFQFFKCSIYCWNVITQLKRSYLEPRARSECYSVLLYWRKTEHEHIVIMAKQLI